MERLRFKEEELQLFIEIDKKIEENPDNMKLHDERENRINQSITRTIREYGGNIQAFHNDIKHEAEKIAKSYNGFPWEHLKEWPALGTPEEVIKNGILANLNVYLDYISERDTDGYNDLMNHVDMIVNQYAKRAQSATQDVTEAPPIKSILTKFPEHHQRPTDKISRDLFSGQLSEAPLAFRFEGDGQTEVTREASIFYETLEAVETGLSPLAEEVYNSLISLYESGNEYITARMVYRSMTGNNRAEVTKERQEAIEKYIRVCAGTQATIRPITGTYRGQILEYGGNILTIKWYTLPINGVLTKCFKITTPPLLYEHARGLGQIGSCPMKILNVPLNKSDDILLIRQYLLRRVMAVKNENNQGKHRLNEIAYKNLYELLGIDDKDKKSYNKKQATRRNAKSILDYWIDEKYIKSYKEEKKGRAAHKVIITA